MNNDNSHSSHFSLLFTRPLSRNVLIMATKDVASQTKSHSFADGHSLHPTRPLMTCAARSARCLEGKSETFDFVGTLEIQQRHPSSDQMRWSSANNTKTDKDFEVPFATESRIELLSTKSRTRRLRHSSLYVSKNTTTGSSSSSAISCVFPMARQCSTSSGGISISWATLTPETGSTSTIPAPAWHSASGSQAPSVSTTIGRSSSDREMRARPSKKGKTLQDGVS